MTLGAVEAAFGAHTEQVAVVCNEIGMLGKYTGAFERAEHHYRRALDICHDVHGSVHDSVATVCHNLGGLAHAKGDPKAGLRFARRAVDIRTFLHGPDHPAVAADVVAWAALVDGCGDDAGPLLERALRVLTDAHDGDHPDIAAALHNVAAVRHRRGDRIAAVLGYTDALAMRERILGPRHPELGTTLVGLAGALRAARGFNAARPHYERAVLVLESAVLADHPVLVAARAGLARSVG